MSGTGPVPDPASNAGDQTSEPSGSPALAEAGAANGQSAHDGHGMRAIVAAFCANLGIAAAKFIGFAFTGSGSMLAEGVHSVADTGNQLLLLLGRRRSHKKANEEHPFGYGRERFFWAFIVAVVLFTLGAAFAVLDGIEKLRNPHEVDKLWWAVGILVVAMVMEASSFTTAFRQARKVRRPGVSLWRYIRNAKAPEVPVVLLEDTAALAGLVVALAAVLLSHFTGDPHWDAYGTLTIGALLAVVAIVLATEMKSLLIGEAASPHQREAIRAALLVEPVVLRIIHLRTEHLGPEELLVAAKVEFLHDLTLPEVAEAVNRVEANVRANVPQARVMYIEPDVSRDRLPPPLIEEHTGISPREWLAQTTGQLEAIRLADYEQAQREGAAAPVAGGDDTATVDEEERDEERDEAREVRRRDEHRAAATAESGQADSRLRIESSGGEPSPEKPAEAGDAHSTARTGAGPSDAESSAETSATNGASAAPIEVPGPIKIRATAAPRGDARGRVRMNRRPAAPRASELAWTLDAGGDPNPDPDTEALEDTPPGDLGRGSERRPGEQDTQEIAAAIVNQRLELTHRAAIEAAEAERAGRGDGMESDVLSRDDRSVGRGSWPPPND